MRKINLQSVAYFSTENNSSFPSTLHHELTTNSPRKHHTFHHTFLSTPLKNTYKQRAFRSVFCIALLTLFTQLVPAQIPTPAPPLEPQTPAAPVKKDKRPTNQREDVEWMWQYSPPPADGRETELVLDPGFRPFLAQFFTAQQTFWGNPKTGYKSLADTALDFLSIPGKVISDENRYLTVTGSVFHFNPSRGLLWVDLNGTRHQAVFAAIDWNKQGKPTTDPAAEYTLWVFAHQPLDPAKIPPALIHSIARWTAEPYAGSTVIQHITNAILVDPDGTPHQIPPASIGANTLSKSETEQKAKP
jgi:hypothetical protein